MLGLGLGRAILFLRQHDAAPYRDIILRACTHWTGYDQQVEGTRTPYLMTVLDETGEIGSYVEPILAAFRMTTDRRDQEQLIRLASELAQDGYAEARDALYERFDRNDTEEPFSCAVELIRIDGLNGLLYVAERMGTMLLDNPDGLGDDDWIVTSTLDDAEEQCGKETVREALGRAAQASSGVRAYVQAADALRAEWASHRVESLPPKRVSYEQIRQQIVEASPPSWGLRGLRNWGYKACDADLVRAAADLLVEQDERRLRAYLEIFGRRAFPLEINRLLALVRHPDDQLMLRATNALSNVSDARVRALALETLADPSLRSWRKSRGVDLLLSNYQPGDEQLLARLLEVPREETEYHSIGFATLDVLKGNLSPAAVPLLHLIYERGPCTNCRKKSVEMLRQLEALPEWLLNECRYDASTYLREAAEAWARGEEPADE